MNHRLLLKTDLLIYLFFISILRSLLEGLNLICEVEVSVGGAFPGQAPDSEDAETCQVCEKQEIRLRRGSFRIKAFRRKLEKADVKFLSVWMFLCMKPFCWLVPGNQTDVQPRSLPLCPWLLNVTPNQSELLQAPVPPGEEHINHLHRSAAWWKTWTLSTCRFSYFTF